MLSWLRSKLRAWLLDEKVKPTKPQIIVCQIGKKMDSAAIVGAVGLKLQVVMMNKTTLIGPENCPSQDTFWEAWKAWSGNPELTWESGGSFDPETEYNTDLGT